MRRAVLSRRKHLSTYTYMTNAELSLIAQEKSAMLQMNDPIFAHYPEVIKNVDTVIWEQRDNYKGLQAIRGIGGQFVRVKKTAVNRFALTPAYYGEFEEMDETDLTRLRSPGTFGDAMPVDDLVTAIQDKLLSREIDRRRAILWLLSTYGAISIVDEFGAILYADSYTPQTFTAATPWGTFATSTPLADLRAIPILQRGKGVRFDGSATIWVNRLTLNNLMSNSNPADLGKKLVNSGQSVNDISDINKIFLANDLPQVAVWDDGYLTEVTITLGGVTYNPNDFVPFIPNGKGVLFGKRVDGSTIGVYEMTRNANNPNSAPGPYNEIIKSERPPKGISVYRGHNGAPALFYPGSLVVLNI